MRDLFLTPPKIDPAQYLPVEEARKIADCRLQSPPAAWGDEIIQTVIRDNPYLPVDQMVVNFKRRDDANGYAVGFITFIGAPNLSLPVIIRQGHLAPVDIMIVGRQDPENTTANDASSDQLLPLTEQNFLSAVGSVDAGIPTPPNDIRGTGYTEDGTGLRLPIQGRTVLASVLGVSTERREALTVALKQDKTACAGFAINRTTEVIDAWLAAPPAKRTLETKLAAAPIPKAVALTPSALPDFVETFKGAAGVIQEDGSIRPAMRLDAIDILQPGAAKVAYLLYDDGTFTQHPAKLAMVALPEPDLDTTVAKRILAKLASSSLRRGAYISFSLGENGVTAPAKIASLRTNEATGDIEVVVTNGLVSRPILLSPQVKAAIRVMDQGVGTWVLPASTPVFMFAGTGKPAASPSKVAAMVDSFYPDCVTVAGDHVTVHIHGHPLSGSYSMAKAAAVLADRIQNSGELLDIARKIGTARFSVDLRDSETKVAQATAAYRAFPGLAREFVQRVGLPVSAAAKLAAALSDPQGTDAILATGMLSDENVAEFAEYASTFEEAADQLARLLLAIRMGFRGDETATAVAMKSLSRVAQDLRALPIGNTLT